MIRRAVHTIVINSKNVQFHQIKCSAMSTAVVGGGACNDAPIKKEKWDLFASVLIERLPIITKPLEPFEKEIQNMLNQVEFEKSLKCDTEMQQEKELHTAELLKKGEIEIDLDAAAKQTVQDLKDQWKEELQRFNPNARSTADDKTNNVKSINRQLSETLILLVEQKLGDNKKYMLLPQGRHEPGETMRETAERIVREQCGEHFNVLFYGNSPCGFYKYKYPVNQRVNSVGAKLFFFRGVLQMDECRRQFKSASPSLVMGVANDDGTKSQPTNYEWLNRTDLLQKVNKSYGESLSQFIL